MYIGVESTESSLFDCFIGEESVGSSLFTVWLLYLIFIDISLGGCRHISRATLDVPAIQGSVGRAQQIGNVLLGRKRLH